MLINNRENRKEKNKGITIVALVVTIIVLLILAGVTLATLSGENGILTKAKTAKEKYKKAQYQEAIDLAVLQTHTEQGKYKIEAQKMLERVRDILKENELFEKVKDKSESWEINPDKNDMLVLTITTIEGWEYTVTEEKTKYLGTEEEVKKVVFVDGDIKFIYDDTWTSGAVKVQIEIAREEYQQYAIQYSFNQENWLPYNTSSEVNIEDNFTNIYVKLIENGIPVTKEYAHTQITNIDRLKPDKVNINKDEAIITTDSITIIGEATDALATKDDGQSGIATCQFSINGGDWVTNENPSYTFTGLTQNTTYQIKMKAIDHAGNETETETEVTTAGIPDLREEDEGSKRANVTFIHDPVGWTNGNVTVTIDTTEKGYILQYNIGDRNREEDWRNYDSPVVMTENGSIYARLKDNANNKGEAIEHKITNIERVKPTIQIQANTTAISQTKQITITAEDTGGSELLDANYYQYYLSTSGAELLGGSWQNYRSGTPFTIGSELNGTYYLWVKQIADNAGNKSETNNGSYHVSSAYMFDNTAPYITINTNSSTTYSNQKTVELTIGDTQSGLASAVSIQYGWCKVGETEPKSWKSMTLGNNYGTKSYSFGLRDNELLTGQYYFWVKPGTLKDIVGNTSTTIVKSTGTFYFDNEGPTITIGSNSNTTYSKSHSVTVTIADSLSGIASGASIQYGWSTSNSTAPTSYTTASLSYTAGTKSTTFTASGSGLTGTYYLWIKPVTLKDVAGNNNTTIIKSTGTFYFDNTGPSINITTNSDTTYSKTKSIMVEISDYNSGLASGVDIQYGWSTSLSTAPTSYTTADVIPYSTYYFMAEGSGLTGQYYLWVKPVTFKDNAGNSTTTIVKSTGTFYFDNTVPYIALRTNSDSSYSTTKSVMVDIVDNNSGIASGASIQYGWSTSLSTAPTSYTTAYIGSYEKGTKGIIVAAYGSGLTGEYYLWVKPTRPFSDVAGNGIGPETIKKSTGTFKFDNTQPTITIGTNSSTTYSKTKSVTVTLSDSHSGIASGTSIQYGWSTSTTTAPTSYTTASLNYTAGTKSTTFTATGRGLTGQYYLWVKPVTLNDVAGNSNTTIVKSTGTFYFDNTPPTIGTVTLKDTSRDISDGSVVKGNSGMISVSNIADTGGSGIAGYYVSTSSTPPTATSVTWTSLSTSSFSYNNVTTAGTRYIWVKDGAGNVSAVKSCTVYVPAAVAKVYLAYYASLQSAINATTNSTVALLVNRSEDVSVASGKTITLNTRLNTLTGTVTNKGTLTVNGVLENDGVVVRNQGTTILSGCQIVEKPGGTSSRTIVNQSGTLTIKDNTTVTKQDGNRLAVLYTYRGATTTIAKATINGYAKADTVANYGTLNINTGAIIESMDHAVIQNHGQVNKNGRND